MLKLLAAIRFGTASHESSQKRRTCIPTLLKALLFHQPKNGIVQNYTRHVPPSIYMTSFPLTLPSTVQAKTIRRLRHRRKDHRMRCLWLRRTHRNRRMGKQNLARDPRTRNHRLCHESRAQGHHHQGRTACWRRCPDIRMPRLQHLQR